MKDDLIRRLLIVYLVLLIPIDWIVMRFSGYGIDGDAVSFMDLADLLSHGHFASVANGYWNPGYPALLAVAQKLTHTSRWNEVGVYLVVNYFIFVGAVAAMWMFVTALDRLRAKMAPEGMQPLLGLNTMRLLGIGLLVIASQRELGLDKVRSDTLLQAFMMMAFAMFMEALASASWWWAPLMGAFFGLAYLAKSFAFVVSLLTIAMLVVFQAWLQRRPLRRVVLAGALALVAFAAVAGPYIGLLSREKGRFDFGDSGSLNYAWTSDGVEKWHLLPGQTARYGGAEVHLIHPEVQLLAHPGIYSYKGLTLGTFPDWFDTTYFDERIKPHINPRFLYKRLFRNVVLIVRYVVNHPEAWILLAVLLLFGARFRFGHWRRNGFWLPMLLIGAAMWGIYVLVNIEERYVTLAYFVLLLPLFAVLRAPREQQAWLPRLASALVVLLAFHALGESLRTAAEVRRQGSLQGLARSWRFPQIYGAAAGLGELGVKPGDEIACLGTGACVNDPYWARLAGVRVVTEVYNSSGDDLLAQWEGLDNRPQVESILKAQGAKVLVGRFDPGVMTLASPAAKNWVRLGRTNYYALPLNVPAPPPRAPAREPWVDKDVGP